MGCTVLGTTEKLKGLAQAANAAHLSASTHWEKLSGGRTNHVYLGHFPNMKMVFKFFDKNRSNPLFSNDIDDEKNVLIALSGTGLSPPFRGRFETDDGPCLVYDFIAGEISSKATSQMIAGLAHLHTHTPTDGLRQVSGAPEAIFTQGLAFLEGDRSQRAKYLRAHVPNVPNLASVYGCFLHGDPTPANTINTDIGVTFVDWQCPAVGDPVHDLSIALSGAMHFIYGATALDTHEIDALLAAYGDEQITDRFRALAPIYRWRMACYCQWKARRGEADYATAGAIEFS
jgi:thiamine kinase